VPEYGLDESEAIGQGGRRKKSKWAIRGIRTSPRPIGQHKAVTRRVQEYIKSGIEEGAELVIGGEGHPQGLEGGNFVKPTVFADVTRDMRIAKEEIFGPVLSITDVQDGSRAIEIANDTEFGSSPT